MDRPRNYIFDFNHSYEDALPPEIYRYDCSGIRGSELYCSEEAAAALCAIIRTNGISGIHFLDSGDYHYITRLMTSFLAYPYDLLLIDHHTDMQEAAFGELLSCGSWAADLLRHDAHLQHLFLVGPDDAALDEAEAASEKVIAIRCSELLAGSVPAGMQMISHPVYISIDKDVLSRRYAVTNWDQGDMSLAVMEQVLADVIEAHEVIGVDICGDLPGTLVLPDYQHADRINAASDRALYCFFKRLLCAMM